MTRVGFYQKAVPAPISLKEEGHRPGLSIGRTDFDKETIFLKLRKHLLTWSTSTSGHHYLLAFQILSDFQIFNLGLQLRSTKWLKKYLFFYLRTQCA